MAVELWIGQEFETTHEREALSHFLVQMHNKFEASEQLYLILVNYFIDGHQIDLTVLKQNAIIVIELKSCAAPFRATENGAWQTIPNGVVIGSGDQNPFEQARDYRFRWIKLLQRKKDEFLSSNKAQSMDFYHVSAFVAISPALHPDCQSQLPPSPWFRLVGLDGLSSTVYEQTSQRLNFSHKELRDLANKVLNLRPVDMVSQKSITNQVTASLNLNTLSNLSPDDPRARIGRYKILELLGRGGMGVVYRAYDPDLNREVAVKVIVLPNPGSYNEWLHRFRREVQAVGQLKHPHIVTLYDVDLESDQPYVVMELLTGGTLKDRFTSGPLPWVEALHLFRPLIQALAYAHQKDIIHRDVKPTNVMFAGDEVNTLKLVDFGLARGLEGEQITQVGAILGTPAYMSPEQALGDTVDIRTDIFSLGIMLFEAIGGDNPLNTGSNPSAFLETVSASEVETSPLLDKAPAKVIKLIERAIAKNPNQRYSSCNDLLEDISECLADWTNNRDVNLTQSSVADVADVNTLNIKQQHSHHNSLAIEFEPPYGTMRPDSKFYIMRTADDFCRLQFSKSQATTLFIQAPRQMGKSSLMHQTIYWARQTLHQPSAFVDFQKFSEKSLTDDEDFLVELCLMIGDALDIPEAIDQYWQGPRSNIVKCSRYMTDHIIPQLKTPFILAMDEVERMLTSPLRSDFFGMLRTWHNDRVYDESFAQLTLFLSSSTEPYLFIDNPSQSPFNVAEVISLQDFSLAEVEELNRRHHSPLTKNQVTELMRLVDGHPFLVRSALYRVATGKIDFKALLAQATEDTGPFGDHLHHYLQRVLDKPDVKQALIHICRDHTYEENKIFYRLKGAGLIKKVNQQVILRNNLYDRYFKERFNA